MKKERLKTSLKRIISWFPDPQYTRLRNLKLFEWVNRNAPGKIFLNLGSGIGRFDQYFSKAIKPINLDVLSSVIGLDIIADAHFLPFKDASFDIVYSVAVLEHLERPWVAADEIFRVLRPGGYVVLELPFLNVIHDEHDYFRFTDKGIRALLDERRFESVFEQIGSGGGSFLSVFLLEYFQQFVPTKYLKTLWRLLARYPFCLAKYLDCFIDRSKELRITANSFSFIGRKK